MLSRKLIDMSGEMNDIYSAIQFNVEERLRELKRAQTQTNDARQALLQERAQPLYGIWIHELTKALGPFCKLYAIAVHPVAIPVLDVSLFVRAQTRNVRTHSLLFISPRSPETCLLQFIHGQRYMSLGIFKLKAFGSPIVWEEEVRGIKKLISKGRAHLRR